MAALNHEIDPIESLKQAPPTDSGRVDGQGVKAFKDVAFGSIAGVLAKYVEYPFDTVKVRLQSQVAQNGQQLGGPVDAFRAAFRSPEGPLRSLYRGVSAPLFGAAVETSSLFFSYRLAQDAWVASSPTLWKEREAGKEKIELPYTALLACGAASGAFTSLLLTPIELVKCKMQVPISTAVTGHMHSTYKPPGPLQIILSISRSHGVLGFWHGQLGTLIRETGGSAAWFGAYEGVKILFLRYDTRLHNIEDVKVWQSMLAGAAAGMSYNFAFYPADTIKSRMQTEDTKGARSGFVATGKELWRQSGLKGFYRGCGITVFRSAPSSAIIFSIYEGLKRYFN